MRRRHPVTVPTAGAIIRDSISAIPRTEQLPLTTAGGRVLARDVIAAIDVPPFDRAAMDGYAVRAADTGGAAERPVILGCTERVVAGLLPSQPLRTGSCTAVATGAPMPPGADAVVMIEHTRCDGHLVQVLQAAETGQHVGTRAADIQAGQTLARAGDYLTPGRVGALAAIGIANVDVYARPRVAIVSTGPELVDPGRVLESGQIYDVNKHMLTALVAEHGAVPLLPRRAADCRSDLTRILDECGNADLVVFSGGTSVGVHDFILEAIEDHGTVLFDSVAVKPGKSTAFGLVNGTPVLALPGYPTACLLNAYVLLVPLLRTLARLPQRPRRVLAPLSRRITSPRDRHHFTTVRLENGKAVPVFKKAGDVTSVSEAHGYVAIAPDLAALPEGTVVEVELF